MSGEKAEQATKNKELLESYNLHWGPVTLQFEPSLSVQYNDNIYWTEKQTVSDVIIRPELTMRAHYPISQLNTLSASVGIGYEYYTQNTQLNSDQPLITPGSELVSHLYVGDAHFRLSESFSYQESLSLSGYNYQTGEFYNLSGAAKYGRYRNKAGVLMDWDLNKVVLTLGYHHENLWSSGSLYSYLNRESELMQASLTYFITQQIKTGIENEDTLNQYGHDASLTYNMTDLWLVKVGPFLDVALSPNINWRVGGGYEAIRTVSASNSKLDDDTYYAYGKISHRLNQHLTQNLRLAKENLSGYSTESQEDLSATYNLTVTAIRKISFGPRFSVEVIDSTGLVTEKYNLYQAGLDANYHISRRWRFFANYNFLFKDSDRANASYQQNSINVGAAYRH